MTRFLTLSFFLFLVLSANAQYKHDYQWLFGRQSSPNDSMQGGTLINFNTNPIQLDYKWIETSIGSYNSSICDKDGDLLFYANGCYIANANHEIMENGDSLNPGIVYDEYCQGSGYFGTQNSFMLPLNGSDNLYYLFHKAYTIEFNPLLIYADKLYYSLIDMSFNGGLGKVIEKNVLILDTPISSGHNTAVRHSNNEDWWIIVRRNAFNRYYKLLFSSTGVDSVGVQIIGEFASQAPEGGGQAVFSPNGEKYIWYNPQDDVHIFDFNRDNAALSNYIHFSPNVDGLSGGAAISPNNRFLYITSWNQIRQYDLEATDIAASEIIVANYDGYLSPFQTNFYQAQLGPDCRIYINSTNGNSVLHVIKYPDEPGLACEVVQHGIHLPTRHGISLPNFPNYRLGTGEPPCNPDLNIDIVVHSLFPDAPEYELSLFPNPVSEDLQIVCSIPAGDQATWVLSNANGQEVGRLAIDGLQRDCSFSTIGLPNGIYFYQLKSELGILESGKVVVVH